jgi:hypothetical protein
VGLTGVIYAILVVCWAAYLLPQALRRHDEAARSRSIERFSSAMRVLARRGSTSSGRMVVTPPRDAPRLVAPKRPLAAEPGDQSERSAVAATRPTRAAQRAAASRRRRVLGLLLVVTLGTGAASAFGLLPPWAAAVPFGLILLFLVIARRQVRRASEEYWAAAGAAEQPPSNVVRREATRVEASHGVVRTDEVPDADEPTVTLTSKQLAAAAAGLAPERVVAVSMDTADGGTLWDPLPVTLPTYVDKPIAKRSVRTIDLGSDGVFSAGHDKADAPAESHEQPALAEESHAAEEQESSRVVNG